MGKFMKSFRNNSLWKVWILVLMLCAGGIFLGTSTQVQAATAGFKTINGKTYYIKKDGTKQKGWLTLNGRKYYFNKTTGVQVKGWTKDSKGKRYFTSKSGAMVTGWLKDSKGNQRYFNPSTGYMATKWLTLDGKKYYFYSTSGIAAKMKFLVDSKGVKRYFTSKCYMATKFVSFRAGKRYFKQDTGQMLTGLRNIAGKYYYFDTSGLLKKSTTVTVNGTTYTIDSNGVATPKKATINNGSTVKIYDSKNSRYYTMVKEYSSHSGIANGKVSDETLLAALCESEAGDQGLYGMEAVAMCVLNRTIKSDKEFPSTIRGVIYEAIPGTTQAQYSVVRDGALRKRLSGQWENRTQAFKAARAAMTIFNKYVTSKTPRKITGFKAKDFNYMYFMMNSSFKRQPLNFSKVKYEVYKDHTFFVDWV